MQENVTLGWLCECFSRCDEIWTLFIYVVSAIDVAATVPHHPVFSASLCRQRGDGVARQGVHQNLHRQLERHTLQIQRLLRVLPTATQVSPTSNSPGECYLQIPRWILPATPQVRPTYSSPGETHLQLPRWVLLTSPQAVFSLTLARSPMASRTYRRASDFLNYSPGLASDILAERKSGKFFFTRFF